MIFKRILALLLAALALVGCSSCADACYDRHRRLEVRSPDVSYTEAFIGDVTDRFVSIARKTALLYRHLNLSETKEATLREHFTDIILPRLQEIKASESELSALLTAYEDFLAQAETAEVPISPLLVFYREAALLFGASRAGRFFYSYALYELDAREKERRDRYLKYGYDFFLSEADEYRRLRGDLQETLGEEGFCRTASMLAFLLSFTEGNAREEKENLFPLGDADTLALLAYQGEHFKSSYITREGWQAFLELLSVMIPEKEDSPLASELYALKKERYFVRAAAALPALTELYASATARLFEDKLWSRTADEATNERAVALALTQGTYTLDEALAAIGDTLKSVSHAEAESIRAHGLTNAYEAFLSDHPPLSQEELADAVQRKATGAQDMPSLASLFFAYTVGQAPYLAFVLSYGK